MNISKRYPKLYKNKDWVGIWNKLFNYYVVNYLYCNCRLFRRVYRVLAISRDFLNKEYAFNEYTRPNPKFKDFKEVVKYNWKYSL